MKKIFYVLMAATVLLFSSCKEKDEVQHRIVGEWYYADEEAGQEIEIYVSFNLNMTFDLYQKIGEGSHRHINGTYSVNRTLVSGMYSDKSPWASDYTVTFIDGNMVMTSVTDSKYSITYLKRRIPDEIKNLSVDKTKSGISEDIYPFL